MMSTSELNKQLKELFSAQEKLEKLSSDAQIPQLFDPSIQKMLKQHADLMDPINKMKELMRPYEDLQTLAKQMAPFAEYNKQVSTFIDAHKVEAPDLRALLGSALLAFGDAKEVATLEDAKAKYLGKNGALTEKLKAMAQLAPEERKVRGADVNRSKEATEEALKTRRDAMASKALSMQLAAESIDVTLPGRGRGTGGIHPVMKTWQRVEEIFASIGFDVADGPEIEADWFNFTALNNPPNHPARSMQDTFYVDMNGTDGLPLLLRTHTSPMQVRYARMHANDVTAKGKAIKVIAPGRTYRVDSDATHSPMFHQVEGLWIAEDISFADLKGVYTDFLHRFFETTALQVRFRPSYFPFTEPSAEIDMKFESGPLKGKWLEISGSGQVHPSVVKNFGLDTEKYIGFAFGSGLERLTMLRYGIGDLRLFFEGDLRFLKQFA